MNMQAEKLELIQMLLETKDKDLIKQVKSLFNIHQKGDDFWDEMPDTIKESVERGLRQSEAGEGIPHEKVVKRLAKWL